MPDARGLSELQSRSLCDDSFAGPGGATREVAAVVDTGFNGYLTLPPTLVAELGLPVVGDGEAVLADGREAVFDVCGVTVVWDGHPRYVETAAVGTDALVGMMLLDGNSLFVEVAVDGRVFVQAMEQCGERPRGHSSSPHTRAGSQVCALFLSD